MSDEIETIDKAAIDDHFSVFERVYFSMRHIAGASALAKQVKHIEDTTSDPSQINLGEYSSFSATVIILCCAFLEAAINEFYMDCAEHPITVSGLSRDLINLYGRLWKKGIPRTSRYSIIEKYNITLEIAQYVPFDQGSSPYQDVKQVVDLRNAFIHYEQENILASSSSPTSQSEAHRFEKALKGRFPESTIWPVGNVFYPSRLLGYGSCVWSVNNLIEFYNQFKGKLGIGGQNVDSYIIK